MSIVRVQLTEEDTAPLVTEDRLIPSGDAGIDLFLRNKRPADLRHYAADRTLLIVHGGTQAAEVTFDLELDGVSWADYIAKRGWDVWMLDIRGFGRSTRPPEMDLPPEEAPPVARTAVAWRDFGAAVDFILQHRGLDRLNALGWSWGTIIAGGWASQNPGKIARLVLFGAAWGVRPIGNASVGYVTWTVEEAFDRLQAGAPEPARVGLTPPHWFQAWAEATVATDDQAHRYTPPRVRSPAGALADIAEAAQTGIPLYDPARIDAATLVIVGEWDGLTTPESARDLYKRLELAPEKRLIEIGGATHFAHLERTRFQFYSAVQAFLEG